MSGAGRRLLRILAWMIALAAVLAGLLICGRGALAGPPLTAPADWHEWVAGREPPEAFVALLRLAALGLCWYLVGTTVAAVVARAVGAAPLTRVVDTLTLPVLRPVMRGALGASLAASTVLTGAPPVFAGPAPPTVAGPAPPVIMMIRLREPSDPAPRLEVPIASPPRITTWQVRPGDTFWEIARNTLAPALGRAPNEREITSYWRRLVDANRDALRDRRNPDLVFPGQVFQLPDLSAGAAPPRLPAAGPQE